MATKKCWFCPEPIGHTKMRYEQGEIVDKTLRFYDYADPKDLEL